MLRYSTPFLPIRRATLRQASPTATKGNCFLIKPPALIPTIFSRHELAHTPIHSHTNTEEGDGDKRGGRSSRPAGWMFVGFVDFALLFSMGGEEEARENEGTHVLKH
ncbi:hypothetical protein AMECASPLE_003116 [Ameca splendens]|uniref:Uncharacterized protein n=2 Tax=Goodeidae TaxID=28758 RepID=A0ABU7C7L3_9TELE|nr:hypothetical protein [Ataeniobius toweri]